MKRLFLILTSLAMLVILGIGTSIIWVSHAQIKDTEKKITQATAEGLALSLSGQMQLLQQLVDTLAQSPIATAALNSKDPVQMQQAATQLEKYIPGILKLRLLLPETTDTDDSAIPAMGYADLDLVRESLTTPQLPVIHDQGPNQHLAVAARSIKNNATLGVILASISPDLIYNKIQNIASTNTYFGLLQGELTLQQRGPVNFKGSDNSPLAVANTHWSIVYGTDPSVDWGQLGPGMGLILLLAIVVAALFYVAMQRLTALLTADQEIILKAFKEFVENKTTSQYSTQLEGMQAIISHIFDSSHSVPKTSVRASENTLREKSNFLLDETGEDSFQDLLNDSRKPELASKTSRRETPVAVKKNAPPTPVSDIFRAYDIRGIVDKTLTKELVYNIGRALGSEAKFQGINQIVLGYDGRISSPSLTEAFAKGIVTTGINVIEIGMVPTPVLYFAAQHIEGRSGVMITGSHNPVNYNGLKIVLNGVTLAEEKIQALKQRIDIEDYTTESTGNIVRNNRYTNDYIGAIADDIHIVRPMKVVIDSGNGVTGTLGPLLLKTLGCNVIELFCEIDGKFPNHHPDPSKPENMRDLVAAVQHYQADVGIAFDGDGDRLGVVDSKGKIIWPDRQLMLFAREVLKARPNTPVVFDVKCSSHLSDQILEYGGQPIMWKSGHSLMKAKLKESGARLAGEMSGHIFFDDRWFGFDDALYAASRLVEILSADPRNSAELFASFPDSYNTPELSVALPEHEKFRFMETLRNTANFGNARITDIDGLRVDFEDGWGLVRASNTTPTLVLRFEADSSDGLKRIQEEFKTRLLFINPNLLLPF